MGLIIAIYAVIECVWGSCTASMRMMVLSSHAVSSIDAKNVLWPKHMLQQLRFLHKRRKTVFYRSIEIGAPLQTILPSSLILCIVVYKVTSCRWAEPCFIPKMEMREQNILLVYFSGFRATMSHMGVKVPVKPPLSHPQPPCCNISCTLYVPLGASLVKESIECTHNCTHARH